MPQPPDAIGYETVTQWLVPAILAGAIHYLQRIATRLGQISESLAVVVNQIDSHERRIAALESARERLSCSRTS